MQFRFLTFLCSIFIVGRAFRYINIARSNIVPIKIPISTPTNKQARNVINAGIKSRSMKEKRYFIR